MSNLLKFNEWKEQKATTVKGGMIPIPEDAYINDGKSHLWKTKADEKMFDPRDAGQIFYMYKDHCVACLGKGEDWLTLYQIETDVDYRKQGKATALLEEVKFQADAHGLKFGSTVALNDEMKRLLKKLEIEEYE